jgi:hypothetical protein
MQTTFGMLLLLFPVEPNGDAIMNVVFYYFGNNRTSKREQERPAEVNMVNKSKLIVRCD